MHRTSTVHWRKSSHSGHSGGECVEVAALSPIIAVRDSKAPDAPSLSLTPSAWRALTQRIKDGEHNLT
jgi:hypothetical protein